ncbi:hypothetical protein [Streptomyces olivaceoviridis]|uniref:hypothetical protein n=1 Tax=Streptomyces olivaceoviridis TaxID=1921 RepID=UPI0036FCA89E
MTWLIAAALLLYLAGIGLLAHAWRDGIQRHPNIQHYADLNPAGVSLWLAIVTVAWPAFLTYALITHLTRRSPR